METSTQPTIIQQAHESAHGALIRAHRDAAVGNQPVRLSLDSAVPGALEVLPDATIRLYVDQEVAIEAAARDAVQLANVLRYDLIVPIDGHQQHDLVVQPGEKAAEVIRDYLRACRDHDCE